MIFERYCPNIIFHQNIFIKLESVATKLSAGIVKEYVTVLVV